MSNYVVVRSKQISFAVALILVVLSSGPVLSQETKIVIPNELRDVEGDDGDDASGGFSNGWRLQTIFPAEQFDSLPDSHRVLTSLRMRPDGVLITSPITRRFADMTMQLSTTTLTAGELSLTFRDNVDEMDQVKVFEGEAIWSTLNTGPVGGPKDFDYGIEFQRPFTYDPDEGNLLVDWTARGFAPSIGFDAVSFAERLSPSVFIDDPNALEADTFVQRFGVFEFTFVPEPASGTLLAIGYLGAIALRRRKR